MTHCAALGGVGKRAALAAAAMVVALAPAAAQADYVVLHSFSGSSTDGAIPYGALIDNGSTLYGMTSAGGSDGDGSIFSMNVNGTGFGVLHSFTPADGIDPSGSLILSGNTLYGMTKGDGGITNYGTIFKMNLDGSGYSVIHTFSGPGINGGSTPHGSLVLSGSTLYGMTTNGGTGGNAGTIFEVDTSGSGFSVLHSFAANTAGNGASPYDSLILSGSTLYGMTSSGGVTGSAGNGTIFSMQTNGSNFTVMHAFSGPDGAAPYGSLLQNGSTLYGMTSGGSGGKGTIFSINADGSGFTTLTSFSNATTDPDSPYGSLILVGSDLYGMTEYGGSSLTAGSAFLFDLNTSTWPNLYAFGAGTDGAYPKGSLIDINGILYGMTSAGGDDNLGVIFSLTDLPAVVDPVPEPATLGLIAGAAALLMRRRRKKTG